MQLKISPRAPKWVIVSAYVGKKKAFKGISFSTHYTYFQKNLAARMAENLNSKTHKDKWPGHDFEFQVIPYGEIWRD